MATSTGRETCGVTLIELIMVISLIGIIAAVATPRYSDSLKQFQAESAAGRIEADLKMARRQAFIMGKDISVLFDTGTHSYSMPNIASLDKSQQPYQMRLSVSPFYASLNSASFPGGTGGDKQVVFNRYGIPDGGGSVVLRCGGTTKTVLLNANSGKVTIQ